MILILRSDNVALNLSAASTLSSHRRGLIADMPNNQMYLIEDFSLDDLAEAAKGRWGTLITIRKEFKGWPQ